MMEAMIVVALQNTDSQPFTETTMIVVVALQTTIAETICS